MSITLDYPRKHVWTYAIGIGDSGSSTTAHYCPCAARRGENPPSFVGDHCYCESRDTGSHSQSSYYTSDPVWDGLDCSISVNCCAHPDMLWFLQQFAAPQKIFIEARICHSGDFSNEGTLVDSMELYIMIEISLTCVLNYTYSPLFTSTFRSVVFVHLRFSL